MGITVRKASRTFQILQDIAAERGESLSDALDRVVEEARQARTEMARRERILEAANKAYAAVAADPVEDASWRAEIAAWDATLLDGLPVEPGPWDEVPEDAPPNCP